MPIGKHVIYRLTIVETEDAVFKPHEVWQATWARIQKKVAAKSESVRSDVLRAQSRGQDPPDLTTRGECMAPLASFSSDGVLGWNKEIVDKIKKLTLSPKKNYC